jgi:hypothetical protein
MKSNEKAPTGVWIGSLLASALVLSVAPGCNRTKAPDPASDDASATNSQDSDASTEVAPPPAVVAGDPNVPVNEGIAGTPPLAADYFADTAPPAPVQEEQPEKPDPNDVWIPGYWWWSVPLHRYVWVAGAWRNPPPGQSWTPGAWMELSASQWSWRPGIWAAVGVAPLPPIETAPPPPRVEVWGPSPGVDFVWNPGYYAWRGGVYEWVVGSWVRPPYVGVMWVGPCYVHMGGRYYFQPGRWDHPPALRGVAYRPDPDVRPGMRFTPQPLPHEVVVAHSNYVSNAQRAAELGGSRQPNGGYVVHGGGMWHPGNSQVAGGPPQGNGPQGNGPPGNGPHGNEQWGANGPHGWNGSQGPAGANPQPGGNEHPGGQEHPGDHPGMGGNPQVGNGPHGGPPQLAGGPQVGNAQHAAPQGNTGAPPPHSTATAQHGGGPPGGGSGGGSGGGHGGGQNGGGSHPGPKPK